MNILEKPVLTGTIVVAKIGGNIIEKEVLLQKLIADIHTLTSSGLSLALVHGGGTAIDKQLATIGKKPAKIQGLRVTDAITLEIVTDVLSSINTSLVNKLASAGVSATGYLPGNIQLFEAEKLLVHGSAGEELDLGFTGKITGVNSDEMEKTFAKGSVPIIAPLGCGKDGSIFNINADHAALAIASALNADKLISITDVPGLLADPKNPCSIIKHINLADAKAIMQSGTVGGGMLPKLQTCIDALEAGVASVQIIDGAEEHGLLKALTALESIGTIVSKSKSTPSSTG